MELTDTAKAKKLFFSYRGSRFHMAREGAYEDYKKFGISEEIEYGWLRELQSTSLAMLRRASNNKLVAEAFERYGEMVARLKDSDGIQFMLEYIKENAVFFDSNTLDRCASEILNIIRVFEDVDFKLGVARDVVALLKNELSHPITISDDYKEKGGVPDYLSIKRVTANIKDSIEYGQEFESPRPATTVKLSVSIESTGNDCTRK